MVATSGGSTRIECASLAAIAIYRDIITEAIGRIASIGSTKTVIVTHDVSVVAPRNRIAGIDCAGQSIVAVYGHVTTNSSRARIIGADAVVIAHDGNVLATRDLIARVRSARVAIIAAYGLERTFA